METKMENDLYKIYLDKCNKAESTIPAVDSKNLIRVIKEDIEIIKESNEDQISFDFSIPDVVIAIRRLRKKGNKIGIAISTLREHKELDNNKVNELKMIKALSMSELSEKYGIRRRKIRKDFINNKEEK